MYRSVPGDINEISPNRRRDDGDQSRGREERAPNGRGRDSSQNSNVGSLQSLGKSKTAVARSGSLSENVVDANGIKKTVLETTSSSEDADTNRGRGAKTDGGNDGADDDATKENSKPSSSSDGGQQSQKKKRRRKKRNAKKGDEQPLMEEGEEE